MKLSGSSALSLFLLLLAMFFFGYLCFLLREPSVEPDSSEYENFRMKYLKKTLMSPEISSGYLFYYRSVPQKEQEQAVIRERYAEQTLKMLQRFDKGKKP